MLGESVDSCIAALSNAKVGSMFLGRLQRLLPCPLLLHGEHSENSVFENVPVVIGAAGVKGIIERVLTEENAGFHYFGDVTCLFVKKVIKAHPLSGGSAEPPARPTCLPHFSVSPAVPLRVLYMGSRLGLSTRCSSDAMCRSLRGSGRSISSQRLAGPASAEHQGCLEHRCVWHDTTRPRGGRTGAPCAGAHRKIGCACEAAHALPRVKSSVEVDPCALRAAGRLSHGVGGFRESAESGALEAMDARLRHLRPLPQRHDDRVIRSQHLHVRRAPAFPQAFDAHGVRSVADVIAVELRKREAARGLAIHEKLIATQQRRTLPCALKNTFANRMSPSDTLPIA